MSRLRALVLGPECNPEEVSIPLVTFSHAAALAKLHDVTLVVRSSVEKPVRAANAPFFGVEVIRTPRLDRLFSWVFRWLFKSNHDGQALTAFRYPFAIAFEWYAWQQLKGRIRSGEFDVVLRVTPMTPSLASPFAFFLRKGPIPFVIGPLNGGLPWPEGFTQLERQREWVAGFRELYHFLPFARSTYRYATAIIAASSQTFAEFAQYRDKVFYVPEPGIGLNLCVEDSRKQNAGGKLALIFVGALVPRKACDLALRGAANLLRAGRAHFTVVGDGPDKGRLQDLVKSLGIEEEVSFVGWLGHAEVLNRMRSADVMVFPTLRDNGAGVIFEALASGAVPVVVDFGGPGDIVLSNVGYKVPLTNETDMASQIERILADLEANRELLQQLRREGMMYARESLTWDAKAQSTTRVLNWAVGRGQKPLLAPPKLLYAERSVSV
jgi:glycosyltransferase involved in cell wall biosynthesis